MDEALPTAAELMQAAEEGRLLDVMLPSGERLGNHRLPGEYFLLSHLTPLGIVLGNLTLEQAERVGRFYEDLVPAMAVHQRKSSG